MKVFYLIVLLSLFFPVWSHGSLKFLGQGFGWLAALLAILGFAALTTKTYKLYEDYPILRWTILPSGLIVLFTSYKINAIPEFSGAVVLTILVCFAIFFRPGFGTRNNGPSRFADSLTSWVLIFGSYYFVEYLCAARSGMVKATDLSYFGIFETSDYRPILFFEPWFHINFNLGYAALTLSPFLFGTFILRMIFEKLRPGIFSISLITLQILSYVTFMLPNQVLIEAISIKKKSTVELPAKSKFPIGSEEFDKEYQDRVR